MNNYHSVARSLSNKESFNLCILCCMWRFSSVEFGHICVPLVTKHGTIEDAAVTNGSYVAHRLICGVQKAGKAKFMMPHSC